MSETLDIAAEPTGTLYAQLLALAAERCATFSLTWRDQLTYDPSADELAVALAPFFIREERTDRWPGTILLGSLATVRHYRLAPDSLRILQTPSSLYAWRAPQLPEDIVFYVGSGALWLTTISHEHDAWFEAATQSVAELQRRIPGLVLTKATQ